MKCLRIDVPYTLKVEDLEESSEKLSLGQLKIRVNRISLCGSDIKLYQGGYSGPCRYPLIFGHEWSGEVIEIPDGENEYAVGDYVTGDCSRWCGECTNCKDDRNLCQHIEKFGITINGYSRQQVIADKKYIYRSEVKLPHKVLALTEPFAVALHALKSADIDEVDRVDRVLVVGCGAIGVAAYMLLRFHYQFKHVFVMEKCSERLDAIKEIIGEHELNVLHMDNGELENEYAAVYKGDGFQYIFEASGTTKGLESAIELANPMGRISYVGMDSGGQISNTRYITMKKLRIQGSIGGTGEFEEVIAFFHENDSMVSKLVTFEADYNEASKAFEAMCNSKRNIKCQICLEDR